MVNFEGLFCLMIRLILFDMNIMRVKLYDKIVDIWKIFIILFCIIIGFF